MPALLSYFSLLWGKLGLKMSLLVICEIFRLIVNILAPDDKYFLCNSEHLPQLIQMQLSKKQKTFSQFFSPFLKSTYNFKQFEKNGDPYSLSISENTYSQRLG